MSRNQYNSVLRSGLTRRLWLVIALAMLIPVGLALFSRWFEAEERRANLQNQELTTLSREKASTLLFNSRHYPGDFIQGLEGRYLVVLDGAGTQLFSSSPVPPVLVQLFERRAPHAVDAPSGTTIIAWYASGREWRGAMTYLPPAIPGDPVSANTVVVFAPEATFGSTASELIPTALGLLALTVLVAFAVAAVVSERYLPPLRGLQRGLARLRERRFDVLPRSAVDEFTPLEREFNTTAMSLQRDWRAFEVLGEVDRALLAASEIDRALDVVLPKFRELTRSQCVGVILLDPTAQAHGRLFMAALGAEELPVQRVTFDSAMLATVRETPEGMTVARIEESRHGFLASMRDAGAEFFWLWPVVDEERLSAMLIVGYHGEPSRDPAVADYGAAFAERLRAALSNSARDERLYRQAHYDPLTQLPNRALFRDRLAQELAAAASGLTRGALMYVDLDHFKRVNDTLGHSAGDQLLSIVAHRLKACTKEGDTVARLGGDEFTVLLRNVGDAETVRQIADRVIRSLALPASLGGRDYQMRASVGVTMFPDDGTDLEEVIRQADLAMYRAKAQGRGRAIFFERDMSQKRVTFTDSGLHRALRRRELSLFYQPQFSLADGRLCGAEALLRWQTRYDGIKLPGEFIPAAEHSGLITDIGGFVLDSACSQYAEWARAGIAPRMFSVNVSVQQLKDGNFVRMVQGALHQHGIAPASLELELVESALADGEVEEPLRAISALGVKLALDDFGTGYSSLNYLRRYPVNTIKLDRSFLDEVPQNDSAGALVESVITMAHTLGKRVTAEGVETSGQLEFLRSRGCESAQGYFLARPMSAAALTEILESRRPGSEIGDERAAG
ncbi:MAG TPA: EAL domain-containing protein [Steroidobacteraceae bacterium]|jgi:diguanylate cyclase (GGDEF)-like protein|nr:EAL domain-containing protein [Steroidobacteraceae bacterium]